MLIYYIKLLDRTSRPIDLDKIEVFHLHDVEMHRVNEKSHDNGLVTVPVIANSAITENIDATWERVVECL